MYKVTTIFYDNGKVKARFTNDSDVVGEHENYDLYIDEFETEKEAKEFIKESKLA